MKCNKLITWLAAAFLGVSAAFVSSAAVKAEATLVTGQTSEKVWYRYDTEDAGVTITGYGGTATVLKIPSYIDNKPVTSISSASLQNKPFTSVILPDTLQSICWPGFAGCSELESINLPSGMTKIEGKVFSNCTSLKSITVPEGVKKIEESTFAGCTSLKTLKILGATTLMPHAISNCPSLESIWLPINSATQRRFDKIAIENCPKLFTVNGIQAIQHRPDNNGVTYPYIHPSLAPLIRNHFSRSTNVGFVNAYCTELCEYVVATETDPWMNDALKARQLHDWLIYHCDYEDSLNGENTLDAENHVASSVFLSYDINVRGGGIGESVCDGYAKAYTMLLTTAGIESYYIGRPSHVWNLVKIQGVFYHIDVTGDEKCAKALGVDTYYYDFLRQTNGYDNALQQSPDDHPLLMVYSDDVSEIINNCPADYPDANRDGILDYDFDLDGYALMGTDYSAFNGFWRFAFGADRTMEQLNNRMSEVLFRLHDVHKDYWTYINDSTPKSLTVKNGDTAEFTVDLFGDNLTFQWFYYDETQNLWLPASAFYGSTFRVMSVKASSYTDKMRFICFVFNQNGYYIYSPPVTLTVIP